MNAITTDTDTGVKTQPIKKPKCKLVGTDGNVFALAGKVTGALRKATLPERAQEFRKQLVECGSYHAALALMSEYVEIS